MSVEFAAEVAWPVTPVRLRRHGLQIEGLEVCPMFFGGWNGFTRQAPEQIPSHEPREVCLWPG